MSQGVGFKCCLPKTAWPPTWINRFDGGPHEANFLKLDCSKLKSTFGWKPRWNLETAVEKVVEWTKYWQAGEDVCKCMDQQIQEFLTE